MESQNIKTSVAWLIELDFYGHANWLSMDFVWTGEANHAIRFVRKEDAEAVMANQRFFFRDSIATEHVFYDVVPE